jgi:16S rRNA (adenine1518-N6/adenine1519-N6)-dimethyltransferase
MKKRRGARLGQHFLTNPAHAATLARAARIHEGDTVLEIGPGKGMLTKELLATSARVIAIEKDEALAAFLQEHFHKEISHGQLQIITGDVRDFDPKSIEGEYALAANIPYYITGEIIRQFLTAHHQPRAMALLIQKEVAERILARDSKESILSISVKAYGTPKIAAKVGRGNFSPPPSVDSAILVVDEISKSFFHTISEEDFFHVVRAGFASKRKMLANNLAVLFGKEKTIETLKTVNIPEKERAEDLTINQWRLITEQLRHR